MNLKSKLPPQLQKYASFGIFPKLLLLPLAFLTILIFIILRPIVIIQIHQVRNWRLGHFVANTELTRLATANHNLNHKKKLITFYRFAYRTPFNDYLSVFWRRHLLTVGGSWGWLLNSISWNLRIVNSSHLSDNCDFEGLFSMDIPPPTFTESEHLIGQKFIHKFCTNGKFICLNVRDDAFLSKVRNKDWSYLNYRNSAISTFLDAANTLANLGYTVFRMGALVKEPLVSKHPRVFDYATNGMRTEFLDIYLGAHCTFCISTGSGWDSIPTIFRRPLMFVNLIPVFDVGPLSYASVIYPKSILHESTRELLNFEEIVGKDLARAGHGTQYKVAGVEIQDLDSAELVEAAIEMEKRVEGTFVETDQQKQMQAKFKQILTTHSKLQPSSNNYPIRAQFASCFLSKYPNFLD